MRIRLFILLGAIVVVGASTMLYRYLAAWESTDDAQIDGYIYPVSSRVSGYVTRVLVDDNQYVQAGTVLVQLDPNDYDVALANAKATLANDQASAAALRINVPITSVNTSSQLSTAQADVENAKAGLVAAQRSFDAAQASLHQAEANDLKAQDDVNRYKPLADKDEIPQQQYVQAVHSQQATAAAGRRGLPAGPAQPAVHHDCGLGKRDCRPKIGPAGTERSAWPADDDHRPPGQSEHLGNG